MRRPTVLTSCSGMATILLCGVDLFIRGKLEALLPGAPLRDDATGSSRPIS